jgi:predicted CoA-substrate-specific enzyme activase
MFYAGIDVGSRTTKAVILDKNGKILCSEILTTGINGKRAADQAVETCLNKVQIRHEDLAFIVSTGYGKKRIARGDSSQTEITCHAWGARYVFPETRTIIDIGGQDSKVIVLHGSGSVADFAMNDRCAAGTGRFLEFMARVLQMELLKMAAIHHDTTKTLSINSLCTVFAESEIISLLSEGHPVEDIVRGLHASVAERTVALLKRVPFVPSITMSGGVAWNRGVVEALQDRLQLTLNIPKDPQIIGALGAAVIARSKALESSKEPSRYPAS